MADFTGTQKAINDLVNKLRKHLGESNTDAALEAINACKDDPNLQNCLSEVIPNITAHMNEDVKKEKPSLFNCCEQLLQAIADSFEPEDVLLQLLEDVEKANDDTAFLTLLSPLRTVLLRLPKRRLNSLGWGLSAVQSYLNRISLPENQNLNEEEILMDADPLVERISFLYFTLAPFYEALIDDLKLSEGVELQERTTVLLKFVLQLLGKPLAFLDLKCAGETKSRGRRVAEDLVKKIVHLKWDIFALLELQGSDSTYDIGSVTDLSLAMLYYMVLVEGVCLEHVPKVYDCLYIFQYSLHLVAELFEHNSQFTVHNGLQLAQVLLQNTNGLVFSYKLLDSNSHCKFCRSLTNVIIYNGLEKHRQKGLEIFRRYLFQFEARGRFLLVSNLMKILNHTGIIGYIVTQYKDMIMQEFNGNSSASFSVYFSDWRLFSLLDVFCYLHKGDESDMIELADQIVASLNLLRFLAIRDKENVTRIWERFGVLRDRYLEPLKRGLILSRAYYEMKIKELYSENAEGDKGDWKVSVVVSGQILAELSTNEKLKVCHSALTSLDIIESLLSRLNELIEAGRSK